MLTVGLTDRIAKGAIAGAAGTTALNAATYLDMAARGRPTSSLPEAAIEKLAETASLQIPGDADSRPNRISGLAALNGLVTGVMVGAAAGLVHPRRRLTTGALVMVAAMGSANGAMAKLGLTDPRQWSATDWASDVIPHLAYAYVTTAALEMLG